MTSVVFVFVYARESMTLAIVQFDGAFLVSVVVMFSQQGLRPEEACKQDIYSQFRTEIIDFIFIFKRQTI